MEKYLYFGTASGADATQEAGMYPASRFCGVEPLTATTTGVYFKGIMNDVDGGGEDGDLITITHADTHATAGSYHRSKLIAKEIARAINAGPHSDGFVTIIDMMSGVHFGEIDTIKGDASFGLAITLDT